MLSSKIVSLLVTVVLLLRSVEGIRVGLVTNFGTVDDGSFNEAAYQGLLNAQQRGAVNDIEVHESETPNDWGPSLDALGQAGFDLVLSVGFFMGDIVAEKAPEYRGTKFAILDFAYSDYTELQNVAGYIFREDQLGYLGSSKFVLVAKDQLQKSTVSVGGGEEREMYVFAAVAGPPIAPVLRFARGMKQAMQDSCSPGECVMLLEHGPDFTSDDFGREVATRMVRDQGAIILQGLGGITGSEAIVAAAEEAAYVSGVDQDEFETTFASEPAFSVRQQVLTSLLKRVDVASERAAIEVAEDTFVPGTKILDASAAGIGLAPCHLTCSISDPTQAAVDEILSQLAEGSRATGVDGDGGFAAPRALQDGQWEFVTGFNVPPGPLDRHCAVALNNNTVLIFGGSNRQTVLGDLWSLDFASQTWQLVVAETTETPAARVEHASVRVGSDGLIIHGGLSTLSAQGEPLADLWLYNHTLNSWTELNQLGANTPGPHHAHTLNWSPSGNLYLFAGRDRTFTTTADLWRYELQSNTWTLIADATGSLPTPRQKHSAIMDPSGLSLFIFGGTLGDIDRTDSGELYRYDVELSEWELLDSGENEEDGTSPSGRAGATLVWTEQRLLLYGGLGNSRFFSDSWLFVIRTGTWREVSQDDGTIAGRHQHAAVRIYLENDEKDTMLVYGGTAELRLSEELWMFGIPPPDPIEERKFFSCKDKEEFVDVSGTVELDREEGIFPEIYLCDNYVDCSNSYDEGYDCSPSVLALYTALGVISFLCLLYIMAMAIVIHIKRAHPIIRASSPFFLYIMLVGAVIGFGAIFAFYPHPSDASCHLQIWLSTISFALMFGSLFLKTYRVWRIFDNETLSIVTISNWYLLRWLSLIFLAEIIILSLWSGIGDPSPTWERESDEQGTVASTKFHLQCTSDDTEIFFWILLSFNALLVAFGVFVSYKSRHISSTFSEASYIGLSIYQFFIVGLFVIPIVLLLDDPFAIEILRSLGMLVVIMLPVLLLTAPKLAALPTAMNWNDEVSKAAASSPPTPRSYALSSSASSSSLHTAQAMPAD